MFKTKASQLQRALKEKGYDGPVSVNEAQYLTDNAGRPRKGAFVVKYDGETMCELLSMPRPFSKLRTYDIEGLALKIASAK